jgi:hypothetical protein
LLDSRGSLRAFARGSKGAKRLLSLREIEDFPLAAKTLRVFATSQKTARRAVF